MGGLYPQDVECNICCEPYDPNNQSQNPCTNPGCSLQICPECIKKCYFVPDDHRGQIVRSFVVCKTCSTLINWNVEELSGTMLDLFKECEFHDIDLNILIKSSYAKFLCDGATLFKCEYEDCVDPDFENNGSNGLFFANKIRCGDIEEAETDKVKKHLCPGCKDLEEKKQINEWEQFGFDISSGYPARICPGCSNIIQRVTDTCPRMKCYCGENFCFCCGRGFMSPEDVYAHLGIIYGTYFPTDEQIKRYLMLTKDIRGSDLNDQVLDQVTDEEIILTKETEKWIQWFEKKNISGPDEWMAWIENDGLDHLEKKELELIIGIEISAFEQAYSQILIKFKAIKFKAMNPTPMESIDHEPSKSVKSIKSIKPKQIKSKKQKKKVLFYAFGRVN